MKKIIKKSILFFLFCLLFSGFALAEMSDQEKREFMESLAKPLKERKVFYRWQDEKERKELLEAGKWTRKLYKRTMNEPDPWAGPGLYVSEDMFSSAYYGRTIIEVEVEPGYKFLDLSDPAIVKELRKKGITDEDVYELNPKVAVKDTEDGEEWWSLKKRKGIKFKPFSSEGMKKIRDKINKLPIESMDEAIAFFKIAGEEFSEADISKILDKLPMNSFDDGVDFFRKAGKYLSESDLSRITEKINKLPLESLHEGILFLMFAGEYLSESDLSRITEKINKLPLENLGDAGVTLQMIESIKGAKDSFEKTIDVPEIITRKVSQYLKQKRTFGSRDFRDSARFLTDVHGYFSKADRTKIINEFLPFFGSIDLLETKLKPHLPDSLIYNEIAAQFKLRKQGIANNQPSRSSSDETARVRCLKKWLQEP